MCQELISQSLETISRLLPRCLETSRLVPRPSHDLNHITLAVYFPLEYASSGFRKYFLELACELNFRPGTARHLRLVFLVLPVSTPLVPGVYHVHLEHKFFHNSSPYKFSPSPTLTCH